ncbi:Arc family DNA-binding protein [Variovorax sp. PBL-E5]|uniref:Arc family DNA-binding protein n=1 Tax=Variovorax sp. PBL-E5 TaxID=434014 RepID=UPI0013199938|nr:Arc family DNA-binding protein [Variovorax sp. PBL-E5]VTU37157.1 Mnt [Variovorax sp. PBL-E5]
MARNDEQANLRLPKDLKDWLVQQASVNRRSLTSEVIVRLEASRAASAPAAQKVTAK